jgi:hypothetical protein
MRLKFNFAVCGAIFLLLSMSMGANAQVVKKKKAKTGSIYFSWGYNHEWYTPSTVHVKQSSLGNDYALVDVNGHDHKGWDEGVFHMQLSIPQYNYRLGYYFNDKQDMGIEINFDHTKYIITDNQEMQIKGTKGGAPINESLTFSAANGFYYFLNNGANFLLFNFVKRFGMYHTMDNKFRLDFTAKAGIGPVIPHVENSFFGQANDKHFQLGGWNTGVETAIRATVMKYAYLEFSQKADYARYSGLRIYQGTARQSFGCYELILSAGVIIPTTRHNPMFMSCRPVAPVPAPAPEFSK